MAGEDDLEVVGTAPDPFVARDKILSLHPDVVTLDVEMPRMDGLTFLKRLMHYHPNAGHRHELGGGIVLPGRSGRAPFGSRGSAAEAGRPLFGGRSQRGLTGQDSCRGRSPASSGPRLARLSPRRPQSSRRSTAGKSIADRSSHAQVIVAIGASTGGTEAIQQVLSHLPADCPGIVITQHIPPVFSRTFAQRMNQTCAMEVKEASDGDLVGPGRALVAPGNFHLLLRKCDGAYRVTVRDGPLVCYQRPSVDVMLTSVAEAAGAFGVGVLLTGMGSDGAQGLLRMRSAGAHTIAQDEESCVVFGMPKEAIRLPAAARVLPLSRIAPAIFASARNAAATRLAS